MQQDNCNSNGFVANDDVGDIAASNTHKSGSDDGMSEPGLLHLAQSSSSTPQDEDQVDHEKDDNDTLPILKPSASSSQLQHDAANGVQVHILNVAIDYVMRDPSPLSEYEYSIMRPRSVATAASTALKSSDCSASPIVDPACNYGANGGIDNTDSSTKLYSPQLPIVPTVTLASRPIQVPVLRIFGPILRKRKRQRGVASTCNNSNNNHDNNRSIDPKQNGCIHIHNAFPYLLARPAFLQDEESSTNISTYDSTQESSTVDDEGEQVQQQQRRTNINDNSDENDIEEITKLALRINWNNAHDVQDNIHVLEDLLEDALLGYEMRILDMNTKNKDKGGGGGGNYISHKNTKINKFIRLITISHGRAFYGYDPNPPSIFLRIEYYNPSHRWKVKGVLEGMKFHCYEAHIPYTMQFFKNYNLSGMNYVKLNGEGVKVRGMLPMHPCTNRGARGSSLVTGRGDASRRGVVAATKKRLRDNGIGSNCNSNGHQTNTNSRPMNDDEDYNCCFLENNTPSTMMWDNDKCPQCCERQKQHHDNNTNNTISSRIMFKSSCYHIRETSCDIEADVSVQHILNINDIITTMHTAEGGSDVYWRAVPSLREMWEEEKFRMNVLLKDYPEANFLKHIRCSQDSNVSDEDHCYNSGKNMTDCTASEERRQSDVGGDGIIEERRTMKSRPGTRLAVRGMIELFPKDLSADFRRVMLDIVNRHEGEIEREDKALVRRQHFVDNIAANGSTAVHGNDNCPKERCLFASSDNLDLVEHSSDCKNGSREVHSPINERVASESSSQGDKGGIAAVLDLFDSEIWHAAGHTSINGKYSVGSGEFGLELELCKTARSPFSDAMETCDSNILLCDSEKNTAANNKLNIILETTDPKASVERHKGGVEHKSRPSISDKLFAYTQSQVTFGWNVDNCDDVVENGVEIEDAVDADTLTRLRQEDAGANSRFVETLPDDESEEQCVLELRQCAEKTMSQDGDSVSHSPPPTYWKGSENKSDGGVGLLVGTPRRTTTDMEDDWAERSPARRQNLTLSPPPAVAGCSVSLPCDALSANSEYNPASVVLIEGPKTIELARKPSLSKVVMFSDSVERGKSLSSSFPNGKRIQLTKVPPKKCDCSLSRGDLRINRMYSMPSGISRGKYDGIRDTSSSNSLWWLGFSGEFSSMKLSVKGKLRFDKNVSKFRCGRIFHRIKAPPHPSSIERYGYTLVENATLNDQVDGQKISDAENSFLHVEQSVDGLSVTVDSKSRKLIPCAASKNSRKQSNFRLPGDDTHFPNAKEDFELACAIEEVSWEDKCSTQRSGGLNSLSLQESILAQCENMHVKSQLNRPNYASQGHLEAAKESDVVHETSCALERSAAAKDEDSLKGKKVLSHSKSIIGERFGITQTVPSPHQEAFSCVSQAVTRFRDAAVNAEDPLRGIGQQGGRLHIAGGGGLKATKSNVRETSSFVTKPRMPVTMMSIEIHVQCRTGKSSLNDAKDIAMRPNSSKDPISAVCYVFAKDPGGGETVELLRQGCVFVRAKAERKAYSDAFPQRRHLGMASDTALEEASSESRLLERISAIVTRRYDPDILVSWDTQGAGIGYLIERGVAIGLTPISSEEKGMDCRQPLDMARLLGRTPKNQNSSSWLEGAPKTDGITNNGTKMGSVESQDNNQPWSGSVLGAQWDDRVGAGAAASSIAGRIVISGWKMSSEEVKHKNASYQPAMAASILRKRLPFVSDLTLTRWYSNDEGRERWRVLQYRLLQAKATLLMLDALDVVGRAGEAARLSGVELSQSLPGIRGSQYKVEGVLLRALQSVRANERGDKTGKNIVCQEKPLWGTIPGSLSLLTNHQLPTQPQSPWKLRRNKGAACADDPVAELKKIDVAVDDPPQPLSSIQERIIYHHQANDQVYYFYSPSKEDCTYQEALEVQALTLEPQSGFHYDPVVVCDFTALYPSLVIAYNLCYSTCAGKLEYHSTRREMRLSGRTTGSLGPLKYPERRSATVLKHHMKSLSSSDESENKEVVSVKQFKPYCNDRVYAVPTGGIFVAESVLKGVLPQVLDELLATRAMIKKASKEYSRLLPNLSPSILRQNEAKQLAIKYLSNVVYGYTSATFSGRSAMPVLADSIVECARRTLSNAVALANSWGRDSRGIWYGAEVLYGDTDSVFVKLPGRTIKEAFRFGTEFCQHVTASNPPPVQLKLEKVYGATLLQTKKRYAGMKYESLTQTTPAFEAKGIETVRRDQCDLTQKILRNALITLFRYGRNAVKAYLSRQWRRIYAGQLPISDFVLTGRVRSRYRGGRVGPVQAALARRLKESDDGHVVRHKERLPYVIVACPGKYQLKDCVLTPMELLERWDAYAINAAYYTKNHVNAALQRCLCLPPYAINVNEWYDACPKPRRRIHHWPVAKSGKVSMISNFFGSDTCGLCGAKCKGKGSAKVVVCKCCRVDRIGSALQAMRRLSAAQERAERAARICSQCNGCFETPHTFAAEDHSSEKGKRSGVIAPLANCVCMDCPITYERHKARESEIFARELCGALDLF